MKISAKAEYACLALLALARQAPESPPMRIREISEEYGIPERYLVQILLRLKGAGLVTSRRGATGGYQLARPSRTISIGQILAAIDGPDVSARHSGSTRRSASVLESVWEEVRAAECAILDRTTVAHLAERASPHDWSI
jgi:Rrf2 family cysteine metabolism transcriptional repressor